MAERLINRKSYQQYYQKIRLMAQKPEAKISGLVSLTIFTVVFFISFAILPTLKTIAALTKEIDDTETVHAKLQQKIHSLQQAEIIFNQVEDDLDKLEKVLPVNHEFERLAWQIQWLAENKQVMINSGSFSEFDVVGQVINQAQEPLIIEIELGISGAYPQIKAFIASLGEVDRLIKVEQLIISSKSVREESDPINASLTLKAFYLP